MACVAPRWVCAALAAAVGVCAGAGAQEGKDATPTLTGTCEVREDGSLLIDGTVSVPGEGTAEKPYLIDWALLAGAAREYDPRAGKTALPAWTAAVEGKRVRVRGHLLLPVSGGPANDLLVMQNEWDGCCIGVPPTPYDAVEVRLASPLDTSRGAAAYGSVEGAFKTDPYIVGGWLMGLYLLEDAKVGATPGT